MGAKRKKKHFLSLDILERKESKQKKIAKENEKKTNYKSTAKKENFSLSSLISFNLCLFYITLSLTLILCTQRYI
jgi:hypothetical protein